LSAFHSKSKEREQNLWSGQGNSIGRPGPGQQEDKKLLAGGRAAVASPSLGRESGRPRRRRTSPMICRSSAMRNTCAYPHGGARE